MRSRRDQLQAYQFVRGRMVSALLLADPNTTDAPLRRISRTTFSGVMVGALAMAGFGVYGLINPGGANRWRSADRVVIESGTGARYVWHGGQLHPMLNFRLGQALPRGRPGGDDDAVARLAAWRRPRRPPRHRRRSGHAAVVGRPAARDVDRMRRADGPHLRDREPAGGPAAGHRRPRPGRGACRRSQAGRDLPGVAWRAAAGPQ